MNDIIAVTTWNDIVSPLYDASCCLLLVGPGTRRETANIRTMGPGERADLCVRAGVETLICGAISNSACAYLVDKKITVVSWIRGPVKQVIAAHRNGKLHGEDYSLPGCCRHACPHGRRRNHRGRGRPTPRTDISSKE